MSQKNGRSVDLHPDRKMRFGGQPQRRQITMDVKIIELIRKMPNDSRVPEWIDSLLVLRGRSTLPLDVKAILERWNR